VNHAVDYSRLTFGDQLARGGSVGTYESMDGRSVSYSDAGFGVLYFTTRTWLGFAIHHLNKPNQSLLMNESTVPRKFSVHGGRRFAIRTAVIRKHKQSFVLAFNYKAQEKYDQLDLGFYYEQHPFYAGLWYRGLPVLKAYDAGHANNDAVAGIVGVIVGDWRFGYSYDLTISSLAGYSAGSHEISTVVEFADRRTRRARYKKRSIPCAKF
jgi:type IX secretion system PorP/SprF family membrane protein